MMINEINNYENMTLFLQNLLSTPNKRLQSEFTISDIAVLSPPWVGAIQAGESNLHSSINNFSMYQAPVEGDV